MGLIGRILGASDAVAQVGQAVGGVAEVFVGNRAQRDAADSQQYLASLAQYGTEFQQAPVGGFDRFVDGLNRLPRPLMVAGTLGLFVYAMAAPVGFSLRMQGLALVPDPLWWLLGAIVSFYFGARELHYQRSGVTLPLPRLPQKAAKAADSTMPVSFAGPLPAEAGNPGAAAAPSRAADPRYNAALEEWRRLRR